MTTDRERLYFHQPPAGDTLHCRGQIYDRPGDGAEARRADLASQHGEYDPRRRS